MLSDSAIDVAPERDLITFWSSIWEWAPSKGARQICESSLAEIPRENSNCSLTFCIKPESAWYAKATYLGARKDFSGTMAEASAPGQKPWQETWGTVPKQPCNVIRMTLKTSHAGLVLHSFESLCSFSKWFEWFALPNMRTVCFHNVHGAK